MDHPRWHDGPHPISWSFWQPTTDSFLPQDTGNSTSRCLQTRTVSLAWGLPCRFGLTKLYKLVGQFLNQSLLPLDQRQTCGILIYDWLVIQKCKASHLSSGILLKKIVLTFTHFWLMIACCDRMWMVTERSYGRCAPLSLHHVWTLRGESFKK